MSTSKELEGLQNKRAELEEESRLLDEKQKTLDERVKILEQKLAIQELEGRNQVMLRAIGELESKMSDLEKRLKKPLEEPETVAPTEEPATEEPTPEEPSLEATETVQEEPVESEEEVLVTEVEGPAIPEQFEEDQRRPHEKKKRRLF